MIVQPTLLKETEQEQMKTVDSIKKSKKRGKEGRKEESYIGMASNIREVW